MTHELITKLLAVCIHEPRGEHNLEGYQRGESYHMREDADGDGDYVLAEDFNRVKKQRDDLLAALEQFLDPEGNPPEDTGEWREVLRVITSAKDGAA